MSRCRWSPTPTIRVQFKRPIWIWLNPSWHNLRFTHTNISPATRGLHYDWNYQWLPMTCEAILLTLSERQVGMHWWIDRCGSWRRKYSIHVQRTRVEALCSPFHMAKWRFKVQAQLYWKCGQKKLMNSSASSVEENFTNHTLRSRDGVSQLRIHLEQRPQLWRQWKASNALIQDLGFRVWGNFKLSPSTFCIANSVMHHLCLKIVEQAPIDPWFSMSTSPEPPKMEWSSNCNSSSGAMEMHFPCPFILFSDPPLHRNICPKQDDCHQWGSGGIKAFRRADHGSNRLEHGSGYGGLHLSTPPSRPPHPADHRNIPLCHFLFTSGCCKVQHNEDNTEIFREGTGRWRNLNSLQIIRVEKPEACTRRGYPWMRPRETAAYKVKARIGIPKLVLIGGVELNRSWWMRHLVNPFSPTCSLWIDGIHQVRTFYWLHPSRCSVDLHSQLNWVHAQVEMHDVGLFFW